MERLKFIGKRLVYLVIMLFGVATLVFILSKLVPGNPVTANLSQRALSDPEIVAAFEAKYGLDKPVWEQYSINLGGLVKGDFGISYKQQGAGVNEMIQRGFPVSAHVGAVAVLTSLLIGM